MKIKVDELSGIKLDYYVAVANNLTDIKYSLLDNKLVSIEVRESSHHGYYNQYNPTFNWRIAGKIIEDNNISTEVIWKENNEILYISKINYGRPWHYEYSIATSSNMLEAAMRCFVKSKLGDEVDDIEC